MRKIKQKEATLLFPSHFFGRFCIVRLFVWLGMRTGCMILVGDLWWARSHDSMLTFNWLDKKVGLVAFDFWVVVSIRALGPPLKMDGWDVSTILKGPIPSSVFVVSGSPIVCLRNF